MTRVEIWKCLEVLITPSNAAFYLAATRAIVRDLLADRDAILAWLRSRGGYMARKAIADAIERGEHLKKE